MSRRLTSTQRPPSYQPTRDNPYQTTTLSATLPVAHTYNQENAKQNTKEDYKNLCGSSLRKGGLCNKIATYDTGVSDDTCSDTNTYYDHHHYGYQYTCKTEPKNSDCMFSDNSDTNQLSYYECDETLPKRFSRHNFYDHSCIKKSERFSRDSKFSSSTYKDSRKIYPNHVNLQRTTNNVTTHPIINLPVRLPASRLSDRPQSSLSSGVTSAVVDGCGGHCQTFENICYYFLQVAFTMGILIGTSLSIAGAVLRKSAARNLQVLVYIGALLSMVSALLLAIQCSARYNVQKRKKALKNAKRTTIPLETLHTRPVVLQQQPLIHERNPTSIHFEISAPHLQSQRSGSKDQQGIPWWRRKDLN